MPLQVGLLRFKVLDELLKIAPVVKTARARKAKGRSMMTQKMHCEITQTAFSAATKGAFHFCGPHVENQEPGNRKVYGEAETEKGAEDLAVMAIAQWVLTNMADS
jgi:hypothetical protein